MLRTSSEDPKKTLPAIPHEAMAKLLETFKKEVFSRLDKLETSLPELVDARIKEHNRRKWEVRKRRLEILLGGIPAGIIVVAAQWVVY